MVISLCVRSYAKRIFPRNSNIVFLMKKGKIFENLGRKGNCSRKGETKKKKEKTVHPEISK